MLENISTKDANQKMKKIVDSYYLRRMEKNL